LRIWPQAAFSAVNRHAAGAAEFGGRRDDGEIIAGAPNGL
jgi:hypothetical protein